MNITSLLSALDGKTNVSISNPKSKGIALLVLALVFLMGFAVGKFNNQPNVKLEEHQQTTSQTTQATDQKNDVNVQAQSQVDTSKDTQNNAIKDTDTTTTTTTDKKPTGETVTTTTTETKTHVDDTATAKQAVQVDTTAKVDVDKGLTKTDTTTTTTKTDLKETITQSQPNWRLAAFAGIDTGGITTKGGLNLGPITYGGEVDRRILGPFWLGAMVDKTASGVGVNAVLSFQF